MNISSLGLLKIRLITQLGLNTFKYEKDKKKKQNKILLSASIVLVGVMLMLYCGASAYGLVKLGISEIIPVYALVISSVLTLFFTIFKANGEIFAFKDYDLLMSLPIRVSTIITSRFLYLYLLNTVFSIIIMLPMGVVYGIHEKPSVSFYFMWFVSMFIASLIPTTIAAVFGAAITAIASKFKNTNKITTILSFIVIITFGFFMLKNGNAQYSLNDMNGIGAIVSEQLTKVYPLANMFQKAIVNADIVAFILFVGISVIWYYLFVKILSLKYKQINTGISTYHMLSNYEIHSMRKESVLVALYKKELKRFFSSTVYVINSGMGVVMAIAFSLAIVVVGPSQFIAYPGIEALLQKVAPFAIAAAISMTCTTCVSLSLEGKNVWIIKSLPIAPKMIYDSKILVNLSLSIPASIISAVLLIIGLKLDVWSSLLIVITPIAYSFFSAVWGIFINNRFGYYDWVSETQIVKQSVGSFVGMFGGLITAVIPALLIGTATISNYRVFTFVVVIVLAIITIFLYKNESRRSIK
ncbi:putative ABC transporter permease subunit [Bacillus nitratireducens]|uniref:putative ABC transporter permease subunit n=1 Tax=Bacillus nitratireducens TaxID=2026193 RepID=UPI000BEBB773|nr:permease [Bacillus nitratireducens]PEE19373.1 permease [Bacillus cereus]MED0902638.1 permease [Bacillus nitratireducens]PFH86624.1 permease [Bacillus cereus]PFI44421.1 permease [Bacillus cereus]PFM61300.1 permease [Bacillus cereus]